MIVDANELENCFFIMGELLCLAFVAVWEIRPAAFGSIGFIIDYEVIAKARPVFFVHSYWKLFFKWSKFMSLKVFTQGKDKGIVWVIWLVMPSRRGFPCWSTKPSNYPAKLCLSYRQSIFLTITNFMKFLCRKMIFRGLI